MRILVLLLSLGLCMPCIASAETPEQAAMRVMDEFLAAFNAEDLEAWRETLHYPHVRFASESVAVSNSPEDYAGPETFAALRATGWRRSHWGARRVVQSGPDKVHVVVEFTRYGEGNEVVGTFESLYIVTRKDGRWGIQARSSFAP